MDLRSIEPTISHTVSQKALIASLDYPEVKAEDLAKRFGISAHMVVTAHRVRQECDDSVITRIMTDPKYTVSRAYRVTVIQAEQYNKRSNDA